ncbi:MAG: RNA ligase A [Caudoviricetes sp.]|nr:MAG: RNA ligase A [Caudoviricetes sp.]
MNFSNIKHYKDLKKEIENRPEFVFNHEEETNSYVVKYNVLFSTSFEHEDENISQLLREARGITFDTSSGAVISRKYHKFYNIGEKPSSSIGNIDFSKTHWIMEKLDGSCISTLTTSPLPVTKAGRSDVAKMVDVWFQKDNYRKFNEYVRENNWTASYEFCSLRQRIVVEYVDENLILTAVRDNITGEYVFNPDELKEIGKEYNIPVVNSYKVENQNIEDIISSIKSAEGIEGIIIRFEDGNMYKVKSDEYIRFHNAVSRIKQEKDIIRIILNDELDDILPIVNDSDKKELINFSDKFLKGIHNITNEIFIFGLANYSDDQKDFAINVIDKNKLYSKFILRDRELFNGDKNNIDIARNHIQTRIKEYIYKESASGPRVEKIRWLFGDICFHKIYMEE